MTVTMGGFDVAENAWGWRGGDARVEGADRLRGDGADGARGESGEDVGTEAGGGDGAGRDGRQGRNLRRRGWVVGSVVSSKCGNPLGVGSHAPRASGSGKTRERTRRRFEDVATSMGARARGREGSGGVDERRRATPGACHDGSNTARSCQLAHLRPGGGGRRADRRAGGHRQAAEQPLSRAGGAKDRHREPKVASRVRVARSVMTRARAPATPMRIAEARWATCAGEKPSAPTAPQFSPWT